MISVANPMFTLLSVLSPAGHPPSFGFWPFAEITVQHLLTLPSATRPATLVLPISAAVPAEPGDGPPSMSRVLGLGVTRIVLDAGHGGHDEGTRGANGVTEKDVVLDVTLRLAHLLRTRTGVSVILTRAGDESVSLSDRVGHANQARGDLFVSIHANSARSPGVSGIETYFLSLSASQPALNVAARENSGSSYSLADLKGLVQSIALNDRLKESEALANTLQDFLIPEGAENRGVKRAPFVVLTGTAMPAVLAEIGFLTNPDEAERLTAPQYRQQIAQALFAGLNGYAQSLAAPCAASAPEGDDDGCMLLKKRAGSVAPDVKQFQRDAATGTTHAGAGRSVWAVAGKHSARTRSY